jgi:hypothetical protein
MWEYLTLIVSSVLALIGAALNTEKDETGKRRTSFKRPNAAGWLVIALLLGSAAVQWHMKSESDEKQATAEVAARTRRASDSTSIARLLKQAEKDSASFKSQLELMQTTYARQLDVLTNTTSLIGQSKQISESMSTNFTATYDRFQKVIDQSTSLLNPVLPMIVGVRIRVPMSNDWMREYLARTTPIRDSLVRHKLLLDSPGIDRISLDEKAYLSGGGSPDHVVFRFTADPSSPFFIDSLRDGAARRFLNPGFNIYFFDAEPPWEYYSAPSALALEATDRVEPPGPKGPFDAKPMSVSYRDSSVVLDVYYRATSLPQRSSTIAGLNQLRGKHLVVSSQIGLNLDYKLEALFLFTGAGYSTVTVIPFERSHDISRRKNGIGNTHSSLVVYRVVDSSLVK